MKTKKASLCKLIYILLLVLLSMCLFGCGKKKSGNQNIEYVLYEKGNDIVKIINQMLNNESYETLIGTAGLEEITNSLKLGDYSEPSKVFEICFNKDYFAYLMESNGAKIQDLPMELRAYVEQRVENQFVAVLNGRMVGTTALAASGVYQASKSFVCEDMSEDTIYLYVFENGYPIIVVFTKGEDGAVVATGSFLVSDGFHVDNASDVKAQLESKYFVNDVTVKEVHYSGEK